MSQQGHGHAAATTRGRGCTGSYWVHPRRRESETLHAAQIPSEGSAAMTPVRHHRWARLSTERGTTTTPGTTAAKCHRSADGQQNQPPAGRLFTTGQRRGRHRAAFDRLCRARRRPAASAANCSRKLPPWRRLSAPSEVDGWGRAGPPSTGDWPIDSPSQPLRDYLRRSQEWICRIAASVSS